LVYRELIKPLPRHDKTPVTKSATKPGEPGGFRGSDSYDREMERSLLGSLADLNGFETYGFKEDGLVKKTMNVKVNGIHHHLVSYYAIEDVVSGTLTTPSQSSQLQNIKPRYELTSGQKLRAPLDQEEIEGYRGDAPSGTLTTPSQSSQLQNTKPRYKSTSGQNFRAPLDQEEIDDHRASLHHSDRQDSDRQPYFPTLQHDADWNTNDMQNSNIAAAHHVQWYYIPSFGPQYNANSNPRNNGPYEAVNGFIASNTDGAQGRLPAEHATDEDIAEYYL
jgi:hypothetical protein